MIHFNKVQKRPLIVEAVQLTQDFFDSLDVRRLDSGETTVIFYNRSNEKPYASIITFPNKVRVNLNDYLMRGATGELYPCKCEVFEKTYTYLTAPYDYSLKGK